MQRPDPPFRGRVDRGRCDRGAGPVVVGLCDRAVARQGYVEFTVVRTLLGRIKIVALNGTTYREIVINPTTGEILRDYWRDRDDNDGGGIRIVNPDDDGPSGSGGDDSGGDDSGGDDSGGDDSGGDDNSSDDADDTDSGGGGGDDDRDDVDQGGNDGDDSNDD